MDYETAKRSRRCHAITHGRGSYHDHRCSRPATHTTMGVWHESPDSGLELVPVCAWHVSDFNIAAWRPDDAPPPLDRYTRWLACFLCARPYLARRRRKRGYCSNSCRQEAFRIRRRAAAEA